MNANKKLNLFINVQIFKIPRRERKERSLLSTKL